MQKNRLLGFFVSILIGLLIGVIYGWFINSPKAVDTSLETLRDDYKTDYVLMIAEIYHADKNTGLATSSLIRFGDPGQVVKQALAKASATGLSEADIALLTELSQGLTGNPPALTPTQKGNK
jgi:hypothetical protein